MKMNRNLRSLVEASDGRRFRDANLEGADFTDANLRNANMRGADLANSLFRLASFRGANFSGSDFMGADLDGVNFSGAKNLDRAVWPKGYRLVKE